MPSGYSKDGVPNGFKNRREKIKCVCETCGNVYYVHPCVFKAGTRFCSNKCLGVGNSINLRGRYTGDKCSSWKGGNSRVYVRLESVRILGYNCQECGTDKFVDTHHLDGNAKNNPQDGSNWKRLCKKCHFKLHTQMNGGKHWNFIPRKIFTCKKCGKEFTKQYHAQEKTINQYCSTNCSNSLRKRGANGQFLPDTCH